MERKDILFTYNSKGDTFHAIIDIRKERGIPINFNWLT